MGNRVITLKKHVAAGMEVSRMREVYMRDRAGKDQCLGLLVKYCGPGDEQYWYAHMQLTIRLHQRWRAATLPRRTLAEWRRYLNSIINGRRM